MGATNRPADLDEAARRRLVKRIYIPLPSRETRLKMIDQLLKKEKHNLTARQLAEIADLTEGYSGSDLAALCKDAAFGPIRDLGSTIRDVSLSKVRPMSFEDLKQSLQQIRPSVSPSTLKAYEEWNKEFGST